MKRKLNILQIYDYMRLGGAETHIITLSNALKKMGHNVWIIAPSGPATRWIDKHFLNHIDVPLDKMDNQLESIIMISKIIKQNEIDIIHTHPFNSQLVSSLCGYLTNIPVVTTVHGAYKTLVTENCVHDLVDKIICVSDETRDYYEDIGVMESELVVIPNAVSVEILNDTHYFFYNNIVRISYISRLDDDKIPSIKLFIESISMLSRIFDIRVDIIGDGGEFAHILDLVNSVNRTLNKEVIRMIGGTTETSNYIKDSDIVIGVGRVILEAISLFRFAICLGNKNYVGVVTKDKLMRISKVNFTDRNSSLEFNPQLLTKDISFLVNSIDKALSDLKETQKVILNQFSDSLIALKHEACYYEVLENYIPRNCLSKHWDIHDYLSNPLKLLLPNENNDKYHFELAKETKILIEPRFDDDNDIWKVAISKMLSTYSNFDPITIIIRISNEYMHLFNQIINELEMLISNFDEQKIPDLLVDGVYHDLELSLKFYSSIDYLIPTSLNLDDQKIKFLLTGGQFITIDG